MTSISNNEIQYTVSEDKVLNFNVLWLRNFWTAHSWRIDDIKFKEKSDSELCDEFFFCLLGGYGITYESNLAAFQQLKTEGWLTKDWFDTDINHEQALS